MVGKRTSQTDLSFSTLLSRITAVIADPAITNASPQLIDLLAEQIQADAFFLVEYGDSDTTGYVAYAQVVEALRAAYPAVLTPWIRSSQDCGSIFDANTMAPVMFSAADADLDPVWQARLAQYELSAILVAPLVQQGQWLGCIEIWRAQGAAPFSPNAAAYAQLVALPIANLINRRRHFEWPAETLTSITTYLTSTLAYDEVLARILETAQRYMPELKQCGISLLEPGEEALRVILNWRADGKDPVSAVGEVVPLADTVIGRLVLETKRPYVQSDVSRLAFQVPRVQEVAASGLQSVLYVPLMQYGRAVGVLHIHEWEQKRQFTPQEIALCQHIANQSALAIENARLHLQVQQQAQELAILHSVVMATAKTVEVDLLLTQITAKIVEHRYPDCFGFALLHPSGEFLTPHPSYYGIPKALLQEKLDLNHSVVGKVVQTRAPLIIPDVTLEPVYHEGLPTTCSEVAVPLWVDGRVIGAINVESSKNNAFSVHDVAFLMTLSGLVGAFLERVKLYEALRNQADNLAQQVAERTVELRNERDRMREILESAGEGIVLINSAGKIVFANHAMTIQTGFAREELHQLSLFGLRSDRTPSALINDLWRTVLAGERWSGEMVNGRKDGSVYDVSVTVVPQINPESGTVSGAVGVLADITRLKEVERLKAEFVSTVTHELRTPLTNITTYLSLLERGKPEKRARYMNILHQEAGRLQQLIEDMLDIARLDTQQLWRNNETAQLASLQEAMGSFGQWAAEKGLSYTWTVPAALPPLAVKRDHLYKMLKNLLTNAFVYSRPGDCVQVTAVPENEFCRIDVADTGPGIPPGEQPRLFERFFRGSRSLDENIPGTGLGLAIVSELAVGYGGQVRVHSEPETETRFSIWLPFAQA